ncbi:MAG TPA: helix-turn-helix domain-containing protein [Gaiellaceae bacterium]|nr:helix-turn-helix domain-containing protein [Gaiellaceae bacterium]
MNVHVELPAEMLDEIVDRVTTRVLAELQHPSAAQPPSPLLTIPETAELLRCSRQRIDDLLSQGRLTRHKEGRRTLLRRTEVEAYLQTTRRNGR